MANSPTRSGSRARARARSRSRASSGSSSRQAPAPLARARPSAGPLHVNPPIARALAARLRLVKVLLCDVDGVLTNATVFLGDGREFKEFHIHDGLGLRLLQSQGIRVGWVSARPSTATRQRAEELRIDFLHQDKGSKVAAIDGILAQAGLTWDQVCYMGDDVVDLGALQRAGVAVAVANAIPEAKARAHYVTEREGGRGAVREVVSLILRAQDRWDAVVASFLA